uniref:Si:dkey-202c14.3 n=1 Tax=Neogobius melanostomus TaxID=47308 RepID=A0A8C6THN1_9GOBI
MLGFPCVLTAICYWYDIQYPFKPSLLLVGDEMGGVHVLQFLNPTRGLFKNVTISKKEHGLQRIYLHHLRDHEGTVSYRYIPGVHQDPVNRIIFESGTKVIMTSSESSLTSVVFFNMSEKLNQYIWKVRGGVTCFDYNARLQLIVTGSSDCVVRMWARYVTTRPVATLLGHHATVLDVAIYQPLEQIFSYSRDAELRVWDITIHECLKIVRLHFPCLQAAQISEHGNFPLLLLSPPLPDETRPHLLVGCKDYLALLSLSEKQRGGSRAGGLAHQLGECGVKVVLSCALHNPSLQQVVTGSTDSTVCVWDLNTGKKKLHISNAHGEEELSCMTLDSSQRRLITGAHNGTIKVWNLLNGLNLHKLQPLLSTVTGLLWLHSDHLVAVGLSHCIVEYDLATSKDLHVKAKSSWKSSIRQQSDIMALCHCPAMDIIAMATQGEVIVWKLETQMPFLHLCKETSSGEVPAVDCLIFLQHRAVNQFLRHKGVLVSSQAGFTCFWSITGEKHTYGHFYAPEQSDERVLALSSNQSENTLLVSGDTLGWLQVWDIAHFGLHVQDQVVSERPTLLHRWRAHSGALLSVEVLEMAERVFILSASDDGSAGLWTLDGDHVGLFGQEALWNLTDPCTFQADSDMQGSLTEERSDMPRRPSPEPCGTGGQTSQGDSPCGKIEQEHQGPQPAMSEVSERQLLPDGSFTV